MDSHIKSSDHSSSKDPESGKFPYAKNKRKMQIARIFAVLLAGILLAGLLTGCRREFTAKDVHKYIRSTLELKSYRIVSGPEDRTNPEEYRDEWWTVTTNEFGFDEPLTFHVINYMHWSGEWATNSLTSDLDGQIFKKLAQDYSEETGIPYILYSYDEFPAPVRDITAGSSAAADSPLCILQSDDYILPNGYFCYPLKTREDFEAPLDEIADFQEYVRQFQKFYDKEFTLRYYVDSNAPSNTDPDSDPAVTIENYYSDYYLSFNADTAYSDFHNKLYSYGENSYNNGAVYDYLGDCLLYGLKDRLSEFSDQEIASLIQMNSDLIEIRDEDGNVPVPNAVYSGVRDYIPLGHLYDLLKYRNIPVTGDWKHFSFTGNDGMNYELGYDMPPLDPEDWYAASYQVSVDDATNMLGMELDNGYPTYEVTIPSGMISDLGMDESELLREMETASDGDIRDISSASDGIHITGKALQFNKIEKANEDRIREIEEEADPFDAGFYTSFNHLSKTYEGIRFCFLSSDIDIPSNQDLFNEAVCRTIINQLLDNPEEPEWYCKVEFVYKINDQTEEKTEFLLPDEFPAYFDYLRNGKAGLTH